MRTLTLTITAAVIGAGLLACKKASNDPKPIPTTTSTHPDAPAWIDNPGTVGPLTAVGIEGPNPMKDLALQRTAATAQGRATLARDLESRIRSVFDQVSQTSRAAAGKKDNQVAQKAQEDILRQLTDVTIRGAQARQFWTDPKTGNLFVLVVLDPALAKAPAQEAMTREMQNLGLGQAELQDAIKRLDAALAKPGSEK